MSLVSQWMRIFSGFFSVVGLICQRIYFHSTVRFYSNFLFITWEFPFLWRWSLNLPRWQWRCHISLYVIDFFRFFDFFFLYRNYFFYQILFCLTRQTTFLHNLQNLLLLFSILSSFDSSWCQLQAAIHEFSAE